MSEVPKRTGCIPAVPILALMRQTELHARYERYSREIGSTSALTRLSSAYQLVYLGDELSLQGSTLVNDVAHLLFDEATHPDEGSTSDPTYYTVAKWEILGALARRLQPLQEISTYLWRAPEQPEQSKGIVNLGLNTLSLHSSGCGGINISNRNLRESSIRQFQLVNGGFCMVQLSGSHFDGVVVIDSRFTDCDFSHCSFTWGNCERCTFERVDFSEASIDSVEFHRCTFVECTFQGTRFSRYTSFSAEQFSDCLQYRGCEFIPPNLPGAVYSADLMRLFRF